MNFAVIQFPASNCDQDAIHAVRLLGHSPRYVWHARKTPSATPIASSCPAVFSYGDYLRCGAIAAHSPVLREVKARADKGMAVIGICNGFQIITEAGLLPGVLLRNAILKFVCRNVGLKVETSQSLFTSRYEQGQVLSIPVAHHDGNYFGDERTLNELENA